MANCKGCGAEIIWLKTKNGKSMPCDANKQLVAKLDSKCDTCPAVERLKSRNELLEVLLFAVVRNSGVLPLGLALKKTEDEIADKTLETVDLLKEMVDIPKMTELRNKAVERRKEGNNEKRKKKV